MSKILAIKARQILDSRGNPTLEVDVITKEGLSRASVPAGASTGKHEALELRDKKKDFFGKSVMNAVKNIERLSKKFVGIDCSNQELIDRALIDLDGTENKSKLGSNTILALSMAVCRAGALSKGIKLYEHINEIAELNKKMIMPKPFFNVINGGMHAGTHLQIQEYMVVPNEKKFSDNLKAGSEIYHELKEIIKNRYGKTSVNVGDEGGFAPNIDNIEEPIQLILEAAKKRGYKVNIAVDAAASSFFKNGKYYLGGEELTPAELSEVYEELCSKYPIISIEDPFAEDSFDDFAAFTKKMKNKVQIVGDDLLVTNPQRIQRAIVWGACNALLLKINQIGTITEAIDAARLAYDAKWNVMVSHRSGETEDSFIADLAVGLGCGQIKAGAPCRGERVAKYNQLLRIEEEIRKQK